MDQWLRRLHPVTAVTTAVRRKTRGLQLRKLVRPAGSCGSRKRICSLPVLNGWFLLGPVFLFSCTCQAGQSASASWKGCSQSIREQQQQQQWRIQWWGGGKRQKEKACWGLQLWGGKELLKGLERRNLKSWLLAWWCWLYSSRLLQGLSERL